jgi:hypothetical protein
VTEKITDTRKRDAQFGIRSRGNLSGDRGGFLKCDLGLIGRSAEVLRLASAAEQDPEHRPVRHGAQQGFARIQATARLIEICLAGVQQTGVA